MRRQKMQVAHAPLTRSASGRPRGGPLLADERGAFPARKLSVSREAPGRPGRAPCPLASPAPLARTRSGFVQGSPRGLASRPPRPRRGTRRDLAALQARTLHAPRGRAAGSRAGGHGEPKNARWGWRPGGGRGSRLSGGTVRPWVGARGRPRPRRRPRSACSRRCSGRG